MKQQVKQIINKIMYRLFGHSPYPSSNENQLRFSGGDQYGLFEYNSKPFDL